MKGFSAQSTLIGAASRAGEFRTFLKAASLAELSDVLRSEGPLTAFAPTDDAFDALPPETLKKLMAPAHRAMLRSVLRSHIAQGRIVAAQINGRRVRGKSLEGGDLRLNGKEGITINGATVTHADIEAANGILHGIDRVLWPQREAVTTPSA